MTTVAEKLGISSEYITPYGRDKAKISLKTLLPSVPPASKGKLILVSALTPTPSGEGKTTVSIGLAQGLKYIGKNSALALREPSLGPVFGRKGGATGGGKSSITPASEIMAVLCMATSVQDLRERLDRMIIGFTTDDEPVYASEMNVTGALMALLKDAVNPNLMQSLEGVPAFVHGGPFANIAHGCNSIMATKMSMTYADYTVTEAGFAFDLGAEKFLDIKCRAAGIAPDAIVIVVTARALKMHGGIAKDDLKASNVPAVERGLVNLAAHLDAAKNYNRPVVVAINQFADDVPNELTAIHDFCTFRGVPCSTANIYGEGGAGGADLARKVVEAIDYPARPFEPLYPLDMPIEEKIRTIAQKIYGADDIVLVPAAKKKLAQFEACGLGRLPVCMAKTQDSLSDDAKKKGRPTDFVVTVRDFEIANGAGYIVALTGNILRMPALPKVPSAERIDIDENGNIVGLGG